MKKAAAISAIIISAVFLVFMFFFSRGIFPLWDSINPALPTTVSYAHLESGAREVDDAQLVDVNGQTLPYRLDFTAWGAEEEYVKITHKGAAVEKLDYLHADDVPAPVREELP